MSRIAHLLGREADPHRAPAEDVRRADEHGEADALCDALRLCRRLRHPPRRHADAEIVGEAPEALAVLREVDCPERRAEYPDARVLERLRELQRRLPAELDDDTFRLLAPADGEHGCGVERLEVEAVARVVVGRYRLGIRVDHDRLVAERPECLCRVDAAVVELDSLADAVRPAADDDDAR
jgi:hypothetical protein